MSFSMLGYRTDNAPILRQIDPAKQTVIVVYASNSKYRPHCCKNTKLFKQLRCPAEHWRQTSWKTVLWRKRCYPCCEKKGWCYTMLVTRPSKALSRYLSSASWPNRRVLDENQDTGRLFSYDRPWRWQSTGSIARKKPRCSPYYVQKVYIPFHHLSHHASRQSRHWICRPSYLSFKRTFTLWASIVQSVLKDVEGCDTVMIIGIASSEWLATSTLHLCEWSYIRVTIYGHEILENVDHKRIVICQDLILITKQMHEDNKSKRRGCLYCDQMQSTDCRPGSSMIFYRSSLSGIKRKFCRLAWRNTERLDRASPKSVLDSKSYNLLELIVLGCWPGSFRRGTWTSRPWHPAQSIGL